MQSKKILMVLGSPNKNSLSTAANKFVVSELMKKYPNSEVSILNLSDSLFAKYTLNANNMDTFWTNVESGKWIDILKQTDILVLSTPMNNFNYSALVKNFLDGICVANKTFSYKYSKQGGSVGLLNNLSVIILATQGAPLGWYPFGDHVTNLKGTFNFLGAKQIESFLIDGTKVAPRRTMTNEDIIKEVSASLKEVANKF
ncbi:FMN-dependent NADH-azoreductase [Mycoplasmopsis adleri]|uniref:FMN-dependent NADH-azoreductase n=1 Tax=Mycoplasmopsis adleri TaxID=51362 RepID=UPI003872C059